MNDNPIKVLFLIHRVNVGGAEQRLLDFVKYEINNKAFSFKVLCLDEKGILGEEISKFGISISVLKWENPIQKLLNLIYFLKREKPDIIHFQLWPARLYSAFIKLFTKCPIIYTIENQQDTITKSERMLKRLFYIFTDKIIAVSNSVKRSYCNVARIKGDKVKIIYNGIDFSRFMPGKNDKTFKKELRLSDNNLVIATISRLADFKGHIYLVRAAKILKDKYPDLRFVIVGEGNSRQDIMREIEKLGLADKFILTGRRRDVANILNAADIFAMPSLGHEGHPIALVEAMAAGKAIIASNIEGINEVANDKNSILVPPKDPVSLAGGIEELVIDQNKRRRLGIEAKKYALSRFSLNAMCAEYENMYREVINKKPKSYRILYVESGSGFGGSTNSLFNIVNHLDRKKFYPIIAIKSLGQHSRQAQNFEVIKLNAYTEPRKLSNFKFFLYILRNIIPEMLKIYRIARRKKISLIHINTNITLGIPVIIASKLAGIPCVCHIRETRELIKREQIFVKWVNTVIVINKDAYKIFTKYIPKEKIALVYNGIDLENFSKDEPLVFRDKFNLNGYPLIGLVARIVEGKGQKEFILAAKGVKKVKPDVKFVIVGDANGADGNYHKEVRELVKKERLEDSVIFSGWQQNTKQLISDLDILVQATTTYPEGLPSVIIEAMALSKPVIATDIPGSREIVEDNRTGLLVSHGDINALARKIIYLLDNPGLAKKMGDEGKKRAEKLFNIKRQIKKVEKIYKEVLSIDE